jgi:integrase
VIYGDRVQEDVHEAAAGRSGILYSRWLALRGRTLDVHALRTTFGTLPSKGGVAPRTAQAAMRHSDIKLTMSVYTYPNLLDVRGALDA